MARSFLQAMFCKRLYFPIQPQGKNQTKPQTKPKQNPHNKPQRGGSSVTAPRKVLCDTWCLVAARSLQRSLCHSTSQWLGFILETALCGAGFASSEGQSWCMGWVSLSPMD